MHIGSFIHMSRIVKKSIFLHEQSNSYAYFYFISAIFLKPKSVDSIMEMSKRMSDDQVDKYLYIVYLTIYLFIYLSFFPSF